MMGRGGMGKRSFLISLTDTALFRDLATPANTIHLGISGRPPEAAVA